MNKLKKSVAGFVFGATMLAAPALASADTIVDIADGDPDDNFSSLVDAVVSQNLVDTLNSEGPFTVFAPVNSAFENLPGLIGRALEEKPELLTDILLYHVAAGNLDSSAVLSSKRIKTVEGGNIVPNLQGGDPYINSSKIISTDVIAENGTVHVIDKVLIPRGVVIEAFRIELKRLQEEFRTLLSDLTHYRSFDR